MVQFGQDKQLGALEQFFGLRSELSALLSRPVDLVEQGALRNPFVIREINQARELVYAA